MTSAIPVAAPSISAVRFPRRVAKALFLNWAALSITFVSGSFSFPSDMVTIISIYLSSCCGQSSTSSVPLYKLLINSSIFAGGSSLPRSSLTDSSVVSFLSFTYWSAAV